MLQILICAAGEPFGTAVEHRSEEVDFLLALWRRARTREAFIPKASAGDLYCFMAGIVPSWSVSKKQNWQELLEMRNAMRTMDEPLIPQNGFPKSANIKCNSRTVCSAQSICESTYGVLPAILYLVSEGSMLPKARAPSKPSRRARQLLYP